MNLVELRNRLAPMVGENIDNLVRFTLTDIDNALNDAYQDLARETGVLEGIVDFVPDSTTPAVYTLPERLELVTRVVYDDYSLFPETSRMMDHTDAEWRTRTGTPERYILDRNNDREILLYKIPEDLGTNWDFNTEYGVVTNTESAADTFQSELGVVSRIEESDEEQWEFDSEYGVALEAIETIVQVWGKAFPAKMAFLSQEPAIPGYAQMAIVYRAASELLMQEGESRNPQLSKAFAILAADVAQFLMRMHTNRTPERIYVLGRSRRFPRGGISRDWRIDATGVAGAGTGEAS